MLTTIKGIYDDGQIILKEEPPVKTKTEVIVTFMTGETLIAEKKRGSPGSVKGLVGPA